MSAAAAFAILAGIVGAAIGSFLNVVAYRLPRGESLLSPPSHCPSCAARIKPYDNVPVFGWLFLRGRCRSCHARIPIGYPLVEAATAGLAVAVVLDFWPSATGIALGMLAVVVLLPLAVIDLNHHVIPNRITVPAAVAAVALGCALNAAGEPERLLYGAGAAGFLLLAALAYPSGMGMGDVKLAGVIGLLLGRNVVPGLFSALLFGIAAGVVVIARSAPGERRRAGIPFGPCLAAGAIVGLFAGHAIIGVYLHQLA